MAETSGSHHTGSSKGGDMATGDDDHAHHAGLAHDLRVLSRRRMLGLVARGAAGLALVPLVTGCSSDDAGTADAAGGDDSCPAIPEETAGPFPGDGTNGANALALAGIVRRDIRASIAGATGVAAGI